MAKSVCRQTQSNSLNHLPTPYAASFVLILGVSLSSVWGCGFFGSMQQDPNLDGEMQPSKAAYEAADPNDEEAGMELFDALQRRFGVLLKKQEFDGAGRVVARMERILRDADDVTRSHPEFEDAELSLSRSRHRLERDIEDDRVAKREARIDGLIDEGEAIIEQSAGLLDELKVRMPSDEDIEWFLEWSQTLDRLDKDGRAFVAEPRYHRHAQTRDAQAIAIHRRTRQAKVQRAWMNRAVPAIEQAFVAVNKARSLAKTRRSSRAPMLAEAHAWRDAAESFAECRAQIEGQDKARKADFELLLPSKFGSTQTAQTTLERCAELWLQAQDRAQKSAWAAQVGEEMTTLDQAINMLVQAEVQNPAAQAQAGRKTVYALTECTVGLRALGRDKRADMGATFISALGDMTVPAIADACAAKQKELAELLPVWEWRSKALQFVQTTDAIVRAQGDAQASVGGAKALWKWEKVRMLGGECMDDAGSLLGSPKAEQATNYPTVWGKMTILGIQDRCRSLMQEASNQSAQLRKNLARSDLAATLMGDAQGYVLQHGVPEKIQTFKVGVRLIYAGSDKMKTAEFDHRGFKVRFNALLKNEVLAWLGRLNKALKPDAAKKQGTKMLQQCFQKTTDWMRHPGFNASQMLTTPWGSLRFSMLQTRCRIELERRLEAGL